MSLKPFKFSRQVEERSREQINEDSEEEEEDTVNNVALASTTSTEVDAQAIEVKKRFFVYSLILKFEVWSNNRTVIQTFGAKIQTYASVDEHLKQKKVSQQ